jgi:hypothetical protein
MRNRSRALVLITASVFLFAGVFRAEAVTRCGTRLMKDGSITVRAAGLTGTPLWGGQLGQEGNSFDNAATCVAGTRARGCTLAPVGAPERVTPPQSCTIFLHDTDGTRCAAYVRRCIPSPLPITCSLFPADNVWNADVSALPVDSQSAAYIASIGLGAPVHPDFGSGLYDNAPIGIPYTVVPAIQPLVPITFYYGDESDPGPYPIPPFAPIEGGKAPGRGRGDRHVLIVDADNCRLYETFDAHRHRRGANWSAGSGATWDLNADALRPADWTSADAAGLPILPGLARYDEVAAGAIQHALRFTASVTQRLSIWPARHYASSSTDPSLPPMGLRVRLKAAVDISGFSTDNQVILTALKHYGMFLADNGSPWFISGVPDPRWDNDDLHALTQLHGSDFEVVDESSLMVDPDSGQVQ